MSQATVESMLTVPHLAFNDPRLFRELLGNQDEHLKIVQRALGVKFRVRGTEMEIAGDPPDAELAQEVMRQLYGLLEQGYPVYGSDVDYAIRILSSNAKAKLQEIFLDTIYISSHKRTITPKSVA
ncbi:MAG: phosphate starvation-inducible protein PhoH, partial [Deltaproteobacteria bacterium]|nr:phosphate starvation-inducible protein PhoH [Deltaproteobacteria bacterium]